MMPVTVLFTVGQRKKVGVTSLILPNMAAVGSGRTGGEPTKVECQYIYPYVHFGKCNCICEIVTH